MRGSNQMIFHSKSRAVSFALLVFLLALSSEVSYATENSFLRILKLETPGMNGDDVATLQENLIDLGFTEVGEVDGWFGPNTETAVKNLQQLLGTVETGIVDAELWRFAQYEYALHIISILKNTSTLSGNQQLNEIRYNYEKLIENGPGHPIGYSVTLRTNGDVVRSLSVRVVGDGSGYIYTAYYDSSNNLQRLVDEYWGVDFDTFEIQTRYIREYFFDTKICVAKVSRNMDREFYFASKDISEREIKHIQGYIDEALRAKAENW